MQTPVRSRVEALIREWVPEVADGSVRIVALAGKPGVRMKVAIRSVDRDVDALGACLGRGGERARAIADALDYTALQFVELRRPDDLQLSVYEALRHPALGLGSWMGDRDRLVIVDGRAIVTLVDPDLRALIERHRNVELASELVGLPITVCGPDEAPPPR